MGFCDRCGAEIAPPNVDRVRQIATCHVCGNVRDLRARKSSGEASDGSPALSTIPGSSAPSPQPGPALLLVLLLFILPAVIWFMIHAFTAELEGSLAFQGELGTKTFRPDECSSGQVLGFAGVELRSGTSLRRLRLMHDELGQPKVAVLEAGHKPIVLGPDQCKEFELSIIRTNTSTNDVYLMEGEAKLDCPSLRGHVKYERCGL